MRKLTMLLLSGGAAIVPMQAIAQEAEVGPGDSNDIVVTAQRRQQSVMDVGISVTAYSGEDLARRNIASSIDVARITPGAFVSSSVGGQLAQFSIRGVTQNDINDFVEGPVAVYVDDTYVPSPQGQSFGLFDLERVEVLRGPQGTLFGRNATGGLVHFVVAKPTSTPEGYVNMTYGRFQQTKLEAALSGPIAGPVDGRISVYWDRNNPWMKNIYPGSYGSAPNVPVAPCCDDAGNQNIFAVRLQLQAEPISGLTIRPTFSFLRQDMSTAPYNQVATVPVVSADGAVIGGEYASVDETRSAIGPNGENYTGIAGSPPSRARGADWFGYLAPNGKSREFGSDYSNKHAGDVRAFDASLHVNYDVGDIGIASITSFKHLRKGMGLDADASPVNFVNVWQEGRTKSLSQEFRVLSTQGSFKWTLGAYYLHVNADTLIGYVAPPQSIFGSIVGFQDDGIALANRNMLTTNSYSAFGQIEYEFAPHLSLIAGVRGIKESQNFSVTPGGYSINNPYDIEASQFMFPLSGNFSDERSKTLWAGKLQLEYKPDRDSLFYLGINRGVKGGNYNSKLPDGSPDLPASAIPYENEVLISYEGGVKKRFFDRAIQSSLSFFYYDYMNYQTFIFTNASGYIVNNDARSYGGELEVSAEPVDGLRVSGSVSLINAKIKGLQIAPGYLRDVKPAFTPSRQVGAEISYEFPQVVLGGKVQASGDGKYVSSFYQNVRNFNSQKLPGYALFNAQVNWKSSTGGLSIAATLNNIFDKRYASTAFDLSTLCGCTEIAYGNPRWWGLRIGYRF